MDDIKLSDDELITLTDKLIIEAQDYHDDKIAPEQAKALRYYMSEPIGNEKKGRSQVVTSDVQDVVEWALPSLIRVFIGGEDVVDFDPVTDEDQEAADAAKAWVNHVIQRDNEGFMLLYTWIKDALIQKIGIVEPGWEEKEESYPETYGDQTDDDLRRLRRDEDFEIAEDGITTKKVQVPVPNPMTGQQAIDEQTGMPIFAEIKLHRVHGTRTELSRKIKIQNTPPEEHITLESTRSISDDGGMFHATRSRVMIQDLRAMGYDVDDDIPGGEVRRGDEDSRYARAEITSESPEDDEINLGTIDPGLRHVWVYRCHVRFDADDSGVPSWWLITRTQSDILDIEHVGCLLLAGWSPIPMSHQWIGRSLADLVVDFQKLKTVLNRYILDYIYMTVNPRMGVAERLANKNTYTDLMNTAIGAPIRMNEPNAVAPVFQPNLPPEVFAITEYWEGQRETRTGIPRINQGLNPDTINKTASGILSIMNAAQARIETIARVFGETGFKRLVNLILKLSAEYPDYLGERTIKLNGAPFKLSPESLRGKYDLLINVGLGTGNKDQQLLHLDTLWNKLIQVMQLGAGPNAQIEMVGLKELHNVIKEMARNMGWRSAAKFINDPEQVEPKQVQPPQPSIQEQIELEKLQLEKTKLQVEVQKQQVELQIEQAKLGIKVQENQLKATQTGAQIAREANVG